MDPELSSFQMKDEKKLWQKVREDPTVPIGTALLAFLVGHGIYSFKKRKIDTSLYIVQYRVIAQGALLGCVTLGMVYAMVKDLMTKGKKE